MLVQKGPYNGYYQESSCQEGSREEGRFGGEGSREEGRESRREARGEEVQLREGGSGEEAVREEGLRDEGRSGEEAVREEGLREEGEVSGFWRWRILDPSLGGSGIRLVRDCARARGELAECGKHT